MVCTSECLYFVVVEKSCTCHKIHNDESESVKYHEVEGKASTSVFEDSHGSNISKKNPEGSETTHCKGHVVVEVTLVPS